MVGHLPGACNMTQRKRRPNQAKHVCMCLRATTQSFFLFFSRQLTLTRWFTKDTNGLAFHSLPLMLGVSVQNNFIMNSLAIPRKAKQAIGGIAKLTNPETKEERYVLVVSFPTVVRWLVPKTKQKRFYPANKEQETSCT